MKKKSKPINKIGAKENKNETRSDCLGTSTFHPFVGGLLVSASIIVGSCRATYDDSTLLEPFIVLPALRIRRSF